MGAFSGCGGVYRSRLSHRTVPHPTNRLGRVHRVFVPEGLSAAEREAWIADHRASLPPNDLVIYRTIIDWPPKGVEADGAGAEEA
jgi:hypothetical protein